MNFTLTDESFHHTSTVHGVLHTYRVMYHATKLCEAFTSESLEKQPREITENEKKTVLCAAFLHDQARRHDFLCYDHGTWAVEEKLEKYLTDFRKFGLTEEDIEALKTAVIYHSLPHELEDSHPHYRVTALLKDADALDRIRLGEHGLDPKYLRCSHTHLQIQNANDLFALTDDMFEENAYPTWENFLTICNAFELRLCTLK